MNDSLYKEIILEHWQHPLNYGVLGDADIDITENNPLCGDEIRLTMKVSNDTLSNIKFTAEGCAIAKSSASLLSEKIIKMSIKNILEISPEEVLDLLGVTLTPSRTKCALLIYQTVQKGLRQNGKAKQSPTLPPR